MSEARLWDLIEDVEVAMLTTLDADGHLVSRPLATIKVDGGDGDLWFFTAKDSPKVAQIQREQHVNLAYASPRRQTYVSVSGVATLTQDESRIDQLWSPAYRPWFPHGRHDPQLALLRVRVTSAQYWSNERGWVATAVGAAMAALSGERYSPGDHDMLDVQARRSRGRTC
ncbi:pyridoxamine 5'-phosphate oxidase family protein [Solimonas soli]|uniref:pyridoxamine 5'-phosphate oxidase family protein n=1 Tax=Solimonas soli TaxID=413479 RepID=UPI000482C44A|nr:pyridoxamine 5'-phosphate oxidase family protein [Solimonas soli]